MHQQVINVPACPLLDSFDSDIFGTVTTIQRSANTWEAMTDTIGIECALGWTEFSWRQDLDGQAAPVEIPKSFCRQYASGLRPVWFAPG